MNRKGKKGWGIALAAVMSVSLIAGCMGKESNNDGSASPSAPASASTAPSASATATATEAPKMFYEMYDTATDSSDLPDWTGKQLNLKVWYTHGTGDPKHNVATNDVVGPEIKRVTGVSLDPDNSFDNGGKDMAVKMGMLNAANDWPDIAITSYIGSLKELVEAGKVYDLTDYIAQYAPNVAKRMPFDKFPRIKETITLNNLDGRTYGFPMQIGDPDKANKIIDPNFVSPNPLPAKEFAWIWVRDDLLKKLYPNAKTQDEIDALYVRNNGKFTREEIYDVPLKSKEDLYKLMRDMQNLIKTEKITENGKPVEVSYAFGGGDNWNALSMLLPSINRLPAGNNYFSYYDKTTKQVQWSYEQEWFKQGVKELSQLAREGVLDKNSLLENSASHLEKLNNGQYAMAYLWETPDSATLAAANKPFRYRKLWIDAPVQEDKFISPSSSPTNNYSVLIFKDKVKEEDVPQIVRYLDYLVSEVGEKMYTWGPRSAGLFDEADGKRTFKDKLLEEAMVYGKDNGSTLTYGLNNTRLGSTNMYGGTWPYHPGYMWGGSAVVPANSYVRVPSAGDAINFFDPGNLPNNSANDIATPLNVDTFVVVYFGIIPSLDEYWKGRDAFEKALTKTLAAKDDAQFEDLWNKFIELAKNNGGDQAIKDINDYFQEKNKGMLP